MAHIAVYTESRLQSSSLPNAFHNYTSFSANAPAERNFIGGVVILARPELSVSELLTIATDKLQLVSVTVEFKAHKPFILVALYRSPTLPFTDFQVCLQQHLVTLRANYQYPILVAGDCNVDARECTVTDIPQYVNSTTHIDGAILDHVYWTGDTSNLSTSVMACYWSDHNIITASIGTHTSVHTEVQQQLHENHKSVSTNPVAICHKRNRKPKTLCVTKSDTAATHTTTTTTAHSAPTNRQSQTVQPYTTSHNTESVKSACEFFDGAMGPDRIQLDINVSIKDLMHQHTLKVVRAPGNGHCLLHSWSSATHCSIDHVKQLIRHEYYANKLTYQNSGIDSTQLETYLNLNNYQLDAADAVIDILCNATQSTVFLVGQKYDYTNPRRVKVVRNMVEVRRIKPVSHPSVRHVLLLKSREHYDSLA